MYRKVSRSYRHFKSRIDDTVTCAVSTSVIRAFIISVAARPNYLS